MTGTTAFGFSRTPNAQPPTPRRRDGKSVSLGVGNWKLGVEAASSCGAAIDSARRQRVAGAAEERGARAGSGGDGDAPRADRRRAVARRGRGRAALPGG